mmetsp:Transcript_39365/g.35054  ORF Transcript_39365/g.35054 Transcript_39365/m.35054 type:complete len:88 (+) Transcript_39365:198-461(+)
MAIFKIVHNIQQSHLKFINTILEQEGVELRNRINHRIKNYPGLDDADKQEELSTLNTSRTKVIEEESKNTIDKVFTKEVLEWYEKFL